MKAAAQKITTKNTAPAKKQVSKTPALTVVHNSNHSILVSIAQTNNWERQADEAADRIMRGELGVARNLTPAPAASLKVPASRAEALPHDVRNELEQSFSAELDAVRIHRDLAADKAAKEENAQAFTSGAHIYFGLGLYRPKKENGRKLILHEITHVLQQTGRWGANGKIRATQNEGTGAAQIQRKNSKQESKDFTTATIWEYAKKTAAYLWRKLKPKEAKFAKLVSLHKPKGRNIKAYMKFVELLEELGVGYVGWRSSSPTRQKLKNFTIPISFKRQNMDIRTAVESLFYDCLKLSVQYDAAIKLLKESDWRAGLRIKTLYLNRPVYLKLVNHEDKEFSVSVTKNPLVRREYNNILWLTRHFLFQPINNYPYKGRVNLLKKRVSKIEMDSKNKKSLTVNEWVYGGLVRIRRLHDLQYRAFCKFRRQARKVGGSDPARQKEIRAVKLHNWGVHLKNTQKYGPLLWMYGLDIMFIAGMALQYYQAGIARAVKKSRQEIIYKRLMTDKVLLELRCLVKDSRLNEQLNVLHKEMLTQAIEFHKPGKQRNGIPTEADYRSRAKQLAKKYMFVARLFEKRQSKYFIYKRYRQLSALIYAEIWFRKMAAYVDVKRVPRCIKKASVRKKSEPKYIKRLCPDYVLAHWIRAARLLKYTGKAFGWQSLVAESDKMLRAEKLGKTKLALVSNWGKSNAPYTKLAELGRIKGGEWDKHYVTGQHLSRFYEKKFYVNLRKAIYKRMPKSLIIYRLQFYFAKYRPLLSLALAEAKLKSPSRWIIKDWEVVFIKKEDKKNWHGIVKNHPKTKALLSNHSGDNILALDYKDNVDPWIWLIPHSDVVKIIKTEHKVEKVNNDLLQKMKDAAKEEAKALKPSIVKGYSLHRYVLTKNYIEPRIEKYSIVNLLAVNREIRAFAWSLPLAQYDLQITALMLSIAKSLTVIGLQAETSTRIIEDWYPFINAARTTINDQSKKEELKKVLFPGEKKYIKTGKTPLEILHRGFKRTYGKTQNLLAMKGNRNKSLKSNAWNFPVKIGDSWYSSGKSGKRYRLISVLRDFIYYPVYGRSVGGTGPKPTLTDHKKEPLPNPEKALIKMEISDLIRISKNQVMYKEKKYSIKGINTFRLNQVATTVRGRGAQLSMSNTGKIIKKIAKKGLSLLEWVPGLGWVISASRVGDAIIRFFASKNYNKVKKLFKRGGILKIFRDILDRFKEKLKVNKLVEFLLLGNNTLVGLFPTKNKDSRKTQRTEDKTGIGRLGKIISGLKRIGKGIVRAFLFLKNRVQRPVKTLALYVATRPGIMFTFQIIATLLEKYGKLTSKSFKAFLPKKFNLRDLKNFIKSGAKGFVQQIQSLYQSIKQLHLPANPIPTKKIFAAVLDILINYLGRRAGKAAKISIAILEKIHLKRRAVNYIASNLTQFWDPNDYWRSNVVPRLESPFSHLRSEFTKRINTVLSARIFSGAFRKVTEPKDSVKFGLRGDQFPGEKTNETQTLSAHKKQVAQPVRKHAIPAITGGEPLSPKLRLYAAVGLGHNFNHVRLHKGRDSKIITDSYQAEGLTTGSHIYLRPNLNPESGYGKRVLFHELTHVVQQTGPRLLSESHSAIPHVGRPNRGLRIDSQQESEANRMSQSAINKSTVIPYVSRSAGRLGFQANSTSLGFKTLGKFIKQIAKPIALERDYEKYNKRINQKTLRYFDDTVQQIANRIAEFDGAKNVSFTSVKTYRKATTKISSHWKSKVKSKKLTNVARKISVELGASAKHRSAGESNEKKLVIKAGDFARRLQAYLFRHTGIGIQFALKLTKGKDDQERLGTKRGGKLVDPTNPIKKIRIYYIYLPYVDRTAIDLWKAPIRKTWPTASRTKIDRLKNILAVYLPTRGITLGIWSPRDYKFTSKVQRDIDALFVQSSPNVEWAKYISTDPNDTGTYGLRVGTYKDVFRYHKHHLKATIKTITGTKKRGYYKRQVHHIPQVVLLKYFQNKARRKLPSKHSHDRDGFKPKSSPRIIEYNKKKIDLINICGKDRCENMPAISMSTYAHTRLSNSKSKKTSKDIRNIFVRERNRRKKHDPDRKNYLAAKATYRAVYKDMIEDLKEGLEKYETMYYRANVVQAGKKIEGIYNPGVQGKGIVNVIRAVKNKQTLMKGFQY